GGKVLRVFRYLDKVLGIDSLGQRVVALLPHLRDVVLPTIAHACDVGVRAAQEQDHGAQRIPARQDCQVLLNDGFEQRRHELVAGYPAFLQAVNIGLGEHAALPCHRVQLQPEVTHLREVFRRDAQLSVDLVNDGASSSGALVVHGRDLLLAACFRVLFEDDDLGVLTAQLDHGTALRIQVLDRQRDRVDLLDELGADVRGDAAAARAGDEDASLTGLDARVGLHALQELQALFGLLGVVALVVAPDDVLGRQVDYYRLHRGRADVQANHQVLRGGYVHNASLWEETVESQKLKMTMHSHFHFQLSTVNFRLPIISAVLSSPSRQKGPCRASPA